MVIYMKYNELEAYYWKIFNIIARVVGLLFCILGSLASIWGIVLIFYPKASKSTLPVDESWYKALITIVPLIFVLFGYLMLKMKPYFPKHIKTKFREEEQNNSQ
jgi:hypothetical protein